MNLRLICLLCFSSIPLFAQDPYGRITGRVPDSAAAVVPGAGVRVTNIETGVATNATTDSSGNYEARTRIPGRRNSASTASVVIGCHRRKRVPTARSP